MKTIRINRAKWLRGNGFNHDGGFKANYLWCPDRKAGCCLGHAIHQTAKCAWKDLSRMTMPTMHYIKPSFLTEFGPDGLASNALAIEAMNINDANDISEEQREKRLIKLFAKNNIKLEFYN